MKDSRVACKLALALWALFLVLVPFYFLGKVPVAGSVGGKWMLNKVEGGVPQVADYLVLIIMAVVFGGLGLRLVRTHVPVVAAFGVFVTYTFLVNLFWTAQLERLSVLYSSLFYAYDVVLLVMLLTLHAWAGETFLRVTLHAMAASVFVQVLLSPLAPDHSWFRNSLFFNNPNQLGYYAILAGTLFFCGSQRFRLHGLYQAGFYLAVLYLLLVCLSKAGLLAGVLLLVLVVLRNPSVLVPVVVTGVLLVGGVFLAEGMAPGGLDNLERRLLVRETDENWAGRGYDRIVNEPEYLFLGAGEGEYHRFQSVLNSELHSSFGTILFCYGIVGLALFTVALYLVCRRAEAIMLLGLVPAFVFGLFHQGLRFSLFWVVLGFLTCLTTRRVPARLPEPVVECEVSAV